MKRLLTILVALAPGAMVAQSVEEIQVKYPDAYMVILDYRDETRFFLKDDTPMAESKITEKRLILDDRAVGEFNKYYIFHGDFTTIDHLDAYTDVPAPDGKGFRKARVTAVRTDNADDEDIFYDDVKQTVFDFPSLSKGAVATVTYTKLYRDLHLFNPFYFAWHVPVLHESYTVTYPSDMEVLYSVRNDSSGQVQVEKGSHSLTFSAEGLKPFESFAGAPSSAYYEPHAIVRLGSYKDNDGARIAFLGDIDDLYRWDYHFLEDMDHSQDGNLRALADSLTQGCTTQEAKARSIYRWVQRHIRYVAFENGLEGFIPRPASLVCERRFGDCKDMASLLTALLRAAGLDAYFTWIGTRDIPYDHTDVPQPISDNHMISTLKLGDRWVFLDGTDPSCIFGFPSAFIQGKQALVAIGPKAYKTLQVPVVGADSSLVTDSTTITWTGSGIHGNSSVYYHGYYGSDACDHLLFKDTSDERDYVKYKMGKGSNKFILDDYNVRYLDEDSKLVNIHAGWDIPDYGKTIAGELFINLNLEKFFTGEDVIDTEKRKVPLEYEYEYKIDQYTIFDIPPGYKLSYLPKDFSYSDDVMDFSIHYTPLDGKVVCRQQWADKTLMMQRGDFGRWNGAVKQILNRYKEQLVLEKNP